MKSLLRASLIIFFMLLPSRVFAQDTPPTEVPSAPASELNIEDLRRRILKEAPEELMSYSLGDANVSFFVTGTWYGELQANFGFYNSPIFGTGFVSPETPLLFKQEADITMALWINERWFVEASFLDDSSQNTYRAGYQGLSGEFVNTPELEIQGSISLPSPILILEAIPPHRLVFTADLEMIK